MDTKQHDHFEWDSDEEATKEELKEMANTVLFVFGTMIILISSTILILY